MAAGPDDLRALPSFDDRFRIHPVLGAESWAAIRHAIEAQDKIERCGIGLDPDKVMAQLDALVDAGFVVKLPRKLFRPVRLPTRLTPTVSVRTATWRSSSRRAGWRRARTASGTGCG